MHLTENTHEKLMSDSINQIGNGVIWAAYNDNFLVAVSHFLRCGIGSFPFKFLGVLMGVNQRRFETWKPVFGKTRKRLSLWKGKRLFIGGG